MIVFDKIGIFIKGLYVVICIVLFLDVYFEQDIFCYVSFVESFLEYYISKGLVCRSEVDGVELYLVFDFKYELGVGVNGIVNDKKVQAGGFVLLEKLGMSLLEDQDDGVEIKIFIIIDDQFVGFIIFVDEI